MVYCCDGSTEVTRHASLSDCQLFQELLLSAHALLKVLGTEIKQSHRQNLISAARRKVSGSCCEQA